MLILLSRFNSALFFSAALLSLSQSAFASEALYKKGAYLQALESFKKTPGTEYSQALCLSRLQRYDEAVPLFGRAALKDNLPMEFHYEHAQALYGAAKLQDALKAFDRSEKAGFKAGASFYYQAYIYQTLEQPDLALSFYRRVIDSPKLAPTLVQSALFETAEIKKARAEKFMEPEKIRETVKSDVLPAYKKVVVYKSDTNTAAEANLRIKELNEKYMPENDPTKRPWALKLGQAFKYDTNVISQAELSKFKLSNTASFVFSTSATGSYSLIRGRWSIKPQAQITFDKHSRQNEPRVYQNDALTLSVGSTQGYSHKWSEKQAQVSLGLGIDYVLRDFKQKHNLNYYSRTFDLSLSEKIPLLSAGTTTFKTGIKASHNVDPSYNARTPYVSLAQSFMISGSAVMILSAGADFQTANNPQNSLTTYKASTAGIIKELFWKIDLRPLFAFSMIDTRLQKTSRGTEMMYTPGIGISRDFGSAVTVDLDYSYTKRNSKNLLLYTYSKHLVSLGATYSF